MKIGKVIRSVRTCRAAECLGTHRFLIIDTGKEDLVAADQVGASPGDRVLFAEGATAARYCMDTPVDAAVVAILGEQEEHVSDAH